MHPNSNDPHNPNHYAQPGALDQPIQSQGGYGQAPQPGYGQPSYGQAPQPGYGQAPQPGGFGQPQPNPHADPFAPAHAHDASMITCPKCHQPSNSIKAYTMMSFLIFIGIGAWWRTKKVVACAGCMRSELTISSLINTVTANVLSPIVWIWHIVLFCMTFGEGHSPEVIGYLR